MTTIEQLEASLTTAIKESGSLNELPKLLSCVQNADPRFTHKAIFALYRVFSVALSSELWSSGVEHSNETNELKSWLETYLDAFSGFLSSLLKDESKTLMISALRMLMSLLKIRSSSVSRPTQPQVHLRHLRIVIRGLLECHPSTRTAFERELPISDRILDGEVAHLFATEWFNSYVDMRWLFFRETESLLKQESVHPAVCENALSILERMSPMDLKSAKCWITEFEDTKSDLTNRDVHVDDEDWRVYFDEDQEHTVPIHPMKHRLYQLSVVESLRSANSHQARLSACWVSILPSLTASPSLSARALTIMHVVVMPHLNHPTRLMDWVAGCVDYEGGTIGLMALNVLYHLMTMHRLDYPDFYTRLYGFLDENVLQMKYRSRFFRLLDAFLASSHIPTALIASFVKRLSRLSLAAPPPALAVMIPFIYNILRRHPALMPMVHNTISSARDPFIATESSPFNTGAISSSLWEIASHRQHFDPSISALAKIYTETFTKPSYNLEDFLDHSYSTMFRAQAQITMTTEAARHQLPPGAILNIWG